MNRIPHRLRRLIVAAVGASLVLALHFLGPADLGKLPSSCVYLNATDKPCAYCGLTRALAAGAEGDMAAANAFNPLWWVAAGIIGWVVFAALLDAITGSRHLDVVVGTWRRLSWWVVGFTVLGTGARLFF